MFNIPGTTCVAAFSFLARNGCARIVICDDVERLRLGMHTNHVRGAMKVRHDGEFSWWAHPWCTLATVFGTEPSLLLSWWFLAQVHGKLVEDYLAIGRYYLEPAEARPADLKDIDQIDEALLFVDLAKAG